MVSRRSEDPADGTSREAYQTDRPVEEGDTGSQSGAEKAAIGPEILDWPDEEEDPDPGADSEGDLCCAEFDELDCGECDVPG